MDPSTNSSRHSPRSTASPGSDSFPGPDSFSGPDSFLSPAKLRRLTGGHRKVPDDWMPATGLRALIQQDPALLWLKFHGKAHGFEPDPEEYSFLGWIGQQGRDFEAAWVKNVCPEAVQALEEDKDVTQVEGLERTLALMAQRVPVITKAALWNAEERLYGSADVIALASWLYRRFPQLRQAQDAGESDHYVVLDCKYTRQLDDSKKKTDLAMNSAQVRVYSFLLGHMQGHMPGRAYLVTRDRIDDPLPVSVEHRLDAPLDPALAEMRDLHTHIKLHGHEYRPWRDSVVAPNVTNTKDEPWHVAKKELVARLPGSPLEKLPHVGAAQAAALRAAGFGSLEDLLTGQAADFPFESLAGIGRGTAARLRAVLRANRTGEAAGLASAAVPPLCDVELFVDFEFFSDARSDFAGDWPELSGCPMIFMVGVGWWAGGKWHFHRFVAAQEHPDAEKEMFREFLTFLRSAGVFDPGRSAALYHWSPAEIWQSEAAAERHRLGRLSGLPWVDVRRVFADTPIGVPGAFGYGLKETVRAVGEYAPGYRSPWPDDLSSGLSAMVMGWRAYDQPCPISTSEMKTLTGYLAADVKGLWQVVRWLRANAERPAGAKTAAQAGLQEPSCAALHWYPPRRVSVDQGQANAVAGAEPGLVAKRVGFWWPGKTPPRS